MPGQYTNFIKDHWLGIFSYAVFAGLVSNFFYNLFTETELRSQFCTFSDRSEKVIIDGTIFGVGYGENAKIRMDMTTVSGDKIKTLHLLVNSMTAYLWRNADRHRAKFPVKVEKKLVLEQLVDVVGELIGEGQLKNYKCANWSVDISKFDVPTNITFIDIADCGQSEPQACRKALVEYEECMQTARKAVALGIFTSSAALRFLCR